MGVTQYYTATSIDGFIADGDNSLDWLFEAAAGGPSTKAERDERFTAFFREIGAMAMGATTYRWVLDHEQLLEHPERWRGFYGDTPSWIFTHRDLPRIPDADLTFVAGDVRDVHRRLVEAAGDRNVWIVGGGELAGQFADHGLLDEILLSVAPVTLGAGAPLLPRRLTSSRLELARVERDGRFASLSYRVSRP